MAAAAFFVSVTALVLVFFLLLVRPSQPLRPEHLIDADVDGLVLVELNRSSPRVDRFLRVLVRPLALEVQSSEEVLQKDISQLLDVFTYRRAIGLFRHDPDTERDQWVWVMGLKRMGSPLKVLITQWTTRDGSTALEAETTDGVLHFRARDGSVDFAVARNAFVAANDRDWLEAILARVKSRPKKEAITARADLLCGALPAGTKHCIARACILVPNERWERWAARDERGPPPDGTIARVCRVFEEVQLTPPTLESLALAATVEPQGRLRFDLTVSCDRASSAAVARRIHGHWPRLSFDLTGPAIASAAEPTTSPAGLHLALTTPPIEQLLGLKPADPPPPPPP